MKTQKRMPARRYRLAPEDLAWDGNALWFVDTVARAIVRLRLPS